MSSTQGDLFDFAQAAPPVVEKPDYSCDLSPDVALSMARDWLQHNLDEGRECPCCGQFAKVYKRKLNSGMAATLCWLVSEFSGDWIDVQETGPRFAIKGGDPQKLRHWGMIEQKPNDDDPSKKDSGIWRPTSQGIEFAKRRVRAPKYVFLYNNQRLRFSEEQTDIIDALGDSFNYTELMDWEVRGEG